MRKIIQIGLILAGIGMASYPWISNSLYEKEAGSRIQVYEKKSKGTSKEKLSKSYAGSKRLQCESCKSGCDTDRSNFHQNRVKKIPERNYREILHNPRK